MASKQGLTQARITLSPASLGEIRISLSQTSSGLVARVVADHPEAVRTLLENGGELRRSLEANGTTLLRLDISASDQPGAQSGASHEARSQSQTQMTIDQNDPADEIEPAVGELAGVSASGASLVDVLA
jgi:flagellar hook-length control protein FliK